MIDMDVVDVELPGCVGETMRTLKKRTMSVGLPIDEALNVLTE